MTWGSFHRGFAPRHASRAIGALLAALICAVFPGTALAQVAQATGQSQAVVVEPLSLLKMQDLNFGRFAARPTAGTVTLDPDSGACSVTGTILHTGGCHYAEFAGMGTRRMTVRIQTPSTINLIGPGGAQMVVDTLTLGLAPGLSPVGGNGNGNGNGNGGGNPRYSINSNSGIFVFRIGGRLNVAANQAAGVYVGTFNVTVQYQ
ncbi:DUF4402 domain-containing protein [Novosphingobium sp. B 225]|uniref:DUF4402 domain-containing protein n=1 Tax=Novosphingobium sp. B 225 TaxID=1961849 RepID=UPI000B4B383C|nr:DUF4402 domain-containing protein [Novosphingobium sp. B 225]